MRDNVAKAHSAHLGTLDKIHASFEKRRTALLDKMSELNAQLAALQHEQNQAADALVQEYTDNMARARQADAAAEQAPQAPPLVKPAKPAKSAKGTRKKK